MNSLEQTHVRLCAQDLDHIRASVDWQAMFSGVGLKRDERKSKAQDWWALSPFTQEKTPSFHMRAGGVWFDFSLGEGGGPIELIQKLHGLNCYEAGRFIVEQGWAHLSAYSKGENTAPQSSVSARSVIDDESSKPILSNAPIRQDLIPMTVPHEILTERGLSEDTCKALGIGYLAQGRSPMKKRLIFQITDAHMNVDTQAYERIILSHMGRAVHEDHEPKYLFYDGFHKSVELYGQEILHLDKKAAEQARETGSLLLTEGPFDMAKSYEAGVRNCVASFGACLSQSQAQKLKQACDGFGIEKIMVAYDRDKAGVNGAQKAKLLLEDLGLKTKIFNWEAPIAKTRDGLLHIPRTITDLCDMSVTQIQWMRQKGLL